MDNWYILVLVLVLFWLIYRLVTIQNRSNTYICPHCGAEFKPDRHHPVFFSYLRCRQCHKHGWQKVARK